jgi:hypothetical protein
LRLLLELPLEPASDEDPLLFIVTETEDEEDEDEGAEVGPCRLCNDDML